MELNPLQAAAPPLWSSSGRQNALAVGPHTLPTHLSFSSFVNNPSLDYPNFSMTSVSSWDSANISLENFLSLVKTCMRTNFS